MAVSAYDASLIGDASKTYIVSSDTLSSSEEYMITRKIADWSSLGGNTVSLERSVFTSFTADDTNFYVSPLFRFTSEDSFSLLEYAETWARTLYYVRPMWPISSSWLNLAVEALRTFSEVLSYMMGIGSTDTIRSQEWSLGGNKTIEYPTVGEDARVWTGSVEIVVGIDESSVTKS